MIFDTWFLEDAGILLVDGDRGRNYPKQGDFLKTGYCLFLSAKNVTKNGFDFSEQIYINEEKDKLLRAGKLNRGDIVVTTRGTIGNVAFYDDTIPFDNVRINSGMMIFRTDGRLWNRRLLYFLLTSEFVKQQIISLTSGSAVPQLPARDLKKFVLPQIPIEIQNQISEIIGSVSYKIEHNRQINQTLEEMAQAIFKSWFVDFEPVKAKIEAKANGQDPERAAMCAISGKSDNEIDQLLPDQLAQLRATAALFPDELTDSELGMIPKGWLYQIANNIAEVAIGKTPPRKEAQWFSESHEDIRWISIRDMGISGVYALNTSEYLTEEAVNKFNVRRIPDNTILLSFKLTVGRIAITVGEMLSNEAIAHFNLTGGSPITTEYLYLYLKQFNYSNLASTSSIATAVNSKTIKNMPIFIPSTDIIEEFAGVINPLFRKIKIIQQENESLREIRDTLLPKLLSGEIEVVQ